MRLKKEIFSNPSNFDVAVTTYEMVRSKDMSGLLRSLNWRVLVLDEGALQLHSPLLLFSSSFLSFLPPCDIAFHPFLISAAHVRYFLVLFPLG